MAQVSYWPPDWGTRLSFGGDAKSLNNFLGDLRKLPEIGLRLILYRGRNDELRRDSAWQLDFSHARPNQLTLYLNVSSTNIDFDKIIFPRWARKMTCHFPENVCPIPGVTRWHGEGNNHLSAYIRCVQMLP